VGRSFGRSTPGGVKTMFGSLPLLNAKKKHGKTPFFLDGMNKNIQKMKNKMLFAIALPVEES